jgi:hypothetical protein
LQQFSVSPATAITWSVRELACSTCPIFGHRGAKLGVRVDVPNGTPAISGEAAAKLTERAEAKIQSAAKAEDRREGRFRNCGVVAAAFVVSRGVTHWNSNTMRPWFRCRVINRTSGSIARQTR